MTTHQRFVTLTAACVLALLQPGCLEVETTTRVNEDGSFERTIEITGDSSALARGGYPLALRGQWEKKLERNEKGKFRLKAIGQFGDVDGLNEAIRGEPARSLQFRAALERRFLWFTTTFRYEETLAVFYPFDAVPVTEFVSPGEIDLFLHHELEEEPYPTPGDSLALDDASERFNAWELRNRLEAFYQELIKGAERAGDPALTAERLMASKEEFYRTVPGQKDPDTAEALADYAAQLFGEAPVRRAMEANREGFDEYDRRLKFLETVATTGLKMSVEMPGLITDTNGPSIEGSRVSWSDFKAYCYVRDYTMWVESRVINWWAIVLTGVVLLALVALFAVSAVRRRPRVATA